MKSIYCLLGLCIFGTAYAHESPDSKGLCAEVIKGKLQPAQKCIISSGGGAGGMYTILKYGKSKLHIEESTMCPEYDTKGCGIAVGRDLDHMSDGQDYYRDKKTGKITEKYENNWSCLKTTNHKIDVCYLIK
ncbi:hypothetical protein A7P53_00135 [Acinetobacter defluvii]|uniref:hypothetical protein n=1 Tax=Acinetobacter defluvii TaxID=1871111 RepID=UPI00148FCA05|nr:hypothetical protein [Acinetobacter defluvii]NNP71301.1 hypothetical protein [Acinetobacter defluvii]